MVMVLHCAALSGRGKVFSEKYFIYKHVHFNMISSYLIYTAYLITSRY